MAETAEHKFISAALDAVLQRIARTRLIGVSEAERRKFDYSAVLLRDFSRPLVSQVLWSHVEGVEKDVRTLLHDREALIKLYFVRDRMGLRQRLDEILSSYRSQPDTRRLLAGLRVFWLPGDFDADRVFDQRWMTEYLQDTLCRDLLFGIVFGNLTPWEFRVFADHGGPLGLKYAVLHEITEHGLLHTPTFKHGLGYSTTGPIREAITMLYALGLIRRLERTVLCFPTIKGRLLLDLTRLGLFEVETRQEWSPEAQLLFHCLGFPQPSFYTNLRSTDKALHVDSLFYALQAAFFCKSAFGKDLLASIDRANPTFYSDFSWRKFYEAAADTPGLSPTWFSDPDALLFVDEEN